VRRYEESRQWPLPSYDPGHVRESISASGVMYTIADEARPQGNPMTCRRTHLAGGVDALRSAMNLLKTSCGDWVAIGRNET
jgi:hypothetical protein